MQAPPIAPMPPFSQEFIQTVRRVKADLRHAFAVRESEEPLSAEEQAWLDRVAEAVVQRRMATPAVLFL